MHICTFVSFALVVGLGSASHRHIEDNSIYKIGSKLDNGFLTFTDNKNSTTPGPDDLKVRVQTWSDGAGQKWKSKKPKLAKSFVFKPTSNEKIKLDTDSDGLGGVFAREVKGKGHDTKYWYVKDMGEGVFQFKNFKTGTCIASQGIGNPVKLLVCDNSPAQQWIFTIL